jgi:hypothetical protein
LLGPYPRAFVVVGGRHLDISRVGLTAPAELAGDRPGTANDRYIRFPCADGEVFLLPA